MTFQQPKSKSTNSSKETSPDNMKKVMEILVAHAVEKNETKRKGFEKVDDTISKMLNATITYYYYLLSITTACIGFAISVTLHQKIVFSDSLIIISLCLWLTAFKFGIDNVTSHISMISNFSFYMQAETFNSTEIAEKTKKVFDDLMNKNAKLSKNPFMYLTLGIFVFMIWYLIKLCTN